MDLLKRLLVFLLLAAPAAAQQTAPSGVPQNLFFNATITLTANTASTSFIPASANKLPYITDFDCTNSSAVTSTMLLQNGSGGTTIYAAVAPATFGFMRSFATPLGGFATMTRGNAVFIQGSASVTSIFCNASGYYQ